ncbi:hypothetical protein [Streptomyces aureoverticillatus]|uniref:hypothetical protein n=1 Tax=Streptomyces aureoverticillatus TaxID=66871 RepID=UPI001EF896B4|nr:hypothetical protein [Streptomyces aureoverticillatus]
MAKILMIGIHPSAIDYSLHPDLDEAVLSARIEQGLAAVRAAGFDAEHCLIGADPEEVEKTVRAAVAGGSVDLAMIGGGVRMAAEHTLLFERVINLLVALAPGIRFCFNTSPETTIDALRRWAPDAS